MDGAVVDVLTPPGRPRGAGPDTGRDRSDEAGATSAVRRGRNGSQRAVERGAQVKARQILAEIDPETAS